MTHASNRPSRRRSFKHALVAFVLLVAAGPLATPTVLAAQEIVPESLTLEQALELARRNNPGFQATRNDLDAADWNVRAAYGNWLPSASVGGGLTWQGSGNQNFGTITAEQLGLANQSSIVSSNYSISANLGISGREVFAPAQAKARRTATGANIDLSGANLDFVVTQVYLRVLRDRESLRLREQELQRAEFNERLARGQFAVGSASQLDVTRAEVAGGRAQAAVLLAEAAVQTARLRLAQQLGMALPEGRSLELTSNFQVSPPRWSVSELRSLALDANPALAALRANERAAGYDVKIARSAYFPSVNLQAGWSGFTREFTNSDFLVTQAQAQALSQMEQCEAFNEIFVRLSPPLPAGNCSMFAVQPEDLERIRTSNNVFPFDFTQQPPSMSLTVSLPIFQGLSRQQNLEAAHVAQEDLRFQLQEQELALSTDIQSRLALVDAAYQASEIERRNVQLSDESLRLAQEQYRLGLVSFLDLIEAETVKAQADQALLNAIFDYHENLSGLESVLGTRLRNP